MRERRPLATAPLSITAAVGAGCCTVVCLIGSTNALALPPSAAELMLRPPRTVGLPANAVRTGETSTDTDPTPAAEARALLRVRGAVSGLGPTVPPSDTAPSRPPLTGDTGGGLSPRLDAVVRRSTVPADVTPRTVAPPPSAPDDDSRPVPRRRPAVVDGRNPASSRGRGPSPPPPLPSALHSAAVSASVGRSPKLSSTDSAAMVDASPDVAADVSPSDSPVIRPSGSVDRRKAARRLPSADLA